MITLKQLIQVAPFPEETKNELLQKAGTLSSDQVYELEDLCWTLISSEYQNKIRFEMQKNLLDSALNQKPSDFDIKKVEEKYLTELQQKFSATGTDEKLEDIREKLEEIGNKGPEQMTTDNNDTAPPNNN
ncbi:hypothetical protein C4577_07845 [Candidatus Parcubacteria bacterium]|nr:MAG: hypothetical protein C4577_07845 [Candidatus Parcubacteria bacterium]